MHYHLSLTYMDWFGLIQRYCIAVLVLHIFAYIGSTLYIGISGGFFSDELSTSPLSYWKISHCRFSLLDWHNTPAGLVISIELADSSELAPHLLDTLSWIQYRTADFYQQRTCRFASFELAPHPLDTLLWIQYRTIRLLFWTFRSGWLIVC
jgi:hypothetical protein